MSTTATTTTEWPGSNGTRPGTTQPRSKPELIKGTYLESSLINEDDDLSDEMPTFLVDGLIHSTTTLLYGRTCSGKSTLAGQLAVALANGDSEFLGQTVAGPGNHTVGIVTGDPGGIAEYRRRIMGHLKSRDHIWADAPYRPAREETWEELKERASERGYTFLIVDNLSSFVPGSLNDDYPIKAVYEQVEWFPRNGIPVLVIAHTSEKWHDGQPSRLPMGSSLIRFGPRWWCNIYRSHDETVLDFDGNDGMPHSITVTAPDGQPCFKVLRTARKRSAKRRDLSDDIREFITAECGDLTAAATARKLADKFSGTEGTHQVNLSRGVYGIKRVDGQWVPASAGSEQS